FGATGGSGGVTGRDQPLLGGVAAGGGDDDPGPAAGRPDRDVEPLVGLVEHDGVATRIGSHDVAQYPAGAVDSVGYDVEEVRRVAPPGVPVGGTRDAFREVGASRRITEAELVQLVAGQVDRVGDEPPVGAGLADAVAEIG